MKSIWNSYGIRDDFHMEFIRTWYTVRDEFHMEFIWNTWWISYEFHMNYITNLIWISYEIPDEFHTKFMWNAWWIWWWNSREMHMNSIWNSYGIHMMKQMQTRLVSLRAVRERKHWSISAATRTCQQFRPTCACGRRITSSPSGSTLYAASWHVRVAAEILQMLQAQHSMLHTAWCVLYCWAPMVFLWKFPIHMESMMNFIWIPYAMHTGLVRRVEFYIYCLLYTSDAADA